MLLSRSQRRFYNFVFAARNKGIKSKKFTLHTETTVRKQILLLDFEISFLRKEMNEFEENYYNFFDSTDSSIHFLNEEKVPFGFYSQFSGHIGNI